MNRKYLAGYRRVPGTVGLLRQHLHAIIALFLEQNRYIRLRLDSRNETNTFSLQIGQQVTVDGVDNEKNQDRCPHVKSGSLAPCMLREP